MIFRKQYKIPFWQEDRSWIPCTVTLCNALCGFAAILYVLNLPDGSTVIPLPAIWMIFSALVFDTLDGFVARKLHAESVHGMNLDSFCDLISFGLAPAIMMYYLGQGMTALIPFGKIILGMATASYFICTMWRLAQYNTMAISETETKGLFTGLPSPAAALSVCSVLLVLDRLTADARTVSIIIVCYAVIVGFLMVSGFIYMHGKKIVTTGTFSVRVTLFILSGIALVRFNVFAAFILIHFYLFSAPLMELLSPNEEESKINPFR